MSFAARRVFRWRDAMLTLLAGIDSLSGIIYESLLCEKNACCEQVTFVYIFEDGQYNSSVIFSAVYICIYLYLIKTLVVIPINRFEGISQIGVWTYKDVYVICAFIFR